MILSIDHVYEFNNIVESIRFSFENEYSQYYYSMIRTLKTK